MVTITKIGEEYNSQILEISGLSTDPKPVDHIDGVSIANGSTFKEIDTGKEYTYNESAETWHINKSASSGGGSGVDGEDGATFTPAVSADGTLSWSNDKGLENPAPVNIKGPKGDTGATGPAGADGAKGEKGDRGEQGLQGIPGEKGDTGAPGADGAKGDKGDKGDTGPAGANGAQGPKGDQGEPGKDGADGAAGKDGTDGKDGEDGGYYTPGVTQPTTDTMQISFAPSKSDMPAVNPVTVNLPVSENSGQNVELDTTLTQSGKAADAKAVGDALDELEGKIPSIDGLAKTEDIPTKPEDIGAQPKGDYLTKAPVESVNGKTGAVKLSASDVGALPNTYTPPDQTAEQVGADPAGTALTVVGEHNVAPDSHNDIRGALKALSDRLTAFFDSDDQTLDELSEIVAYIKSNKSLIDAITTSKVSVSDIVNDLTTNVANRPLSAAQGVVLKALFDKIPEWALAASKPSYTKSEVGLSNVDNVRQYSASNPPPYPVTSVNGQTGAVTVDVPTKVSQLDNDSKFISAVTEAMITAALGYTPINPGKVTLGRHEDGLLYLFVDSKPVGTGVELPTGGIDGYITEDKQIVFNNLPDGEYTLAYLMEDGSIVTIGELVKDTNTYYSITNNLTNCTNSNSATQVVEGESYSATITANSGYELESVTVTMGGVDITATAVSGTEINIASVSGDIVITAVAVEAVNTPGYTNLAKNFTSGRFNSSGAITTSTLQNSVVCEDYIPFEAGTTVRIKGLQMGAVDSVNHCVQFTNSSKVNLITSNHSYPGENGSKTINWKKETDEVYQYNNVSNADCTYMRVSGVLVGSTVDVIITVNEEIPETPAYTNLAKTFAEGYRISASSGLVAQAGATAVEDYIPVNDGDTVYIKGFGAMTDWHCGFYNADKVVQSAGKLNAQEIYGTYAYDSSTGVASFTLKDPTNIRLMRFSGALTGTTADVIITVNEPIV